MPPFSSRLPLLALALVLFITAGHGLEELPADAEAGLAASLRNAKSNNNANANGACGTRPLVIVYGANPPTDLAALVEDQPPLPRLPPIASGADIELHQAAAQGSCLSSVRRIRGTLLVLDDGALPSSLSLLSSLQHVGESLIVYGVNSNAALTSLSGLGALESTGHLAIARLPRLASLGGLEKLRAVNGGLALWRLPELQTLDAMGPIQVVQERVWIENTPKLLSLGRLPQLPPATPAQVSVARITRQDGGGGGGDASSSSVSGLSALRSIGLDLHIENTDLPSLELPSLATVGGEIALLNNKRLASTQGLRALASAFGVALINNALLADVDGFARVTELKGDLSLVRNAAIQSVNGFSAVRSIGLSLDVSSNPALRSLDGFGGLAAVGQLLNVAFNPSLEALRGFGALRTVGSDLIVRNNTQLRELTDLGASLQAVGTGRAGGALVVEGNAALASLAPLAAPPLQVVRGEVRVRAGNGFSSAASEKSSSTNDAAVRAIEALAQPDFAFYPPQQQQQQGAAAAGAAAGGVGAGAAAAVPPAGAAALPAPAAATTTVAAAPARLPSQQAPVGTTMLPTATQPPVPTTTAPPRAAAAPDATAAPAAAAPASMAAAAATTPPPAAAAAPAAPTAPPAPEPDSNFVNTLLSG